MVRVRLCMGASRHRVAVKLPLRQTPSMESEIALAAKRFGQLITHCVNLVEIHSVLGGGRRGARGSHEQSLNRAVIVLSVAAWQTAAQDLGVLAVESRLFRGNGPSPKSKQVILNEIEAFSTPSPERVSSLFSDIGVEPVQAWSTYKGGRPKEGTRGAEDLEKFLVDISRSSRRKALRRAPRESGERWADALESPVSRLEMDVAQWVQLRHTIAHGESSIPAFDVLSGVRVYRRKLAATMSGYVSYMEGPEAPTIRRAEAVDCIQDICRMTYLTAKAVHDAALEAEIHRAQQQGPSLASKDPMHPLARMNVEHHWKRDLTSLRAQSASRTDNASEEA